MVWNIVGLVGTIVTVICFLITVWVLKKERQKNKGLWYANKINDFWEEIDKKMAKKVFVRLNNSKDEIISKIPGSKSVLVKRGEGYYVYYDPDERSKYSRTPLTGLENFKFLERTFIENQIKQGIMNVLDRHNELNFSDSTFYSDGWKMDEDFRNKFAFVETFNNEWDGSGFYFSFVTKVDKNTEITGEGDQKRLTFYYRPSKNSIKINFAEFVDGKRDDVEFDECSPKILENESIQKLISMIKMDFREYCEREKDFKKEPFFNAYRKSEYKKEVSNNLKWFRKISKIYSKKEKDIFKEKDWHLKKMKAASKSKEKQKNA